LLHLPSFGLTDYGKAIAQGGFDFKLFEAIQVDSTHMYITGKIGAETHLAKIALDDLLSDVLSIAKIPAGNAYGMTMSKDHIYVTASSASYAVMKYKKSDLSLEATVVLPPGFTDVRSLEYNWEVDADHLTANCNTAPGE
jgi:hypothetical protein